MPTSETLERFIARVEENAHAEAIEEFYTENGSIQENQSAPRIGRASLIENERRVMAKTKGMRSTCIRPVFINGDKAILRWIFRFDWLDGTFTEIEEIAYQVWKDQRIASETFFYDPAQRAPKNPGSL